MFFRQFLTPPLALKGNAMSFEETSSRYQVVMLGRAPRSINDDEYANRLKVHLPGLATTLSGSATDVIDFLTITGQIHYIIDGTKADGDPDQIVGAATVVVPVGSKLCRTAIIQDFLIRRDLGRRSDQHDWTEMLLQSVMIDLKGRATKQQQPLDVTLIFPVSERMVFGAVFTAARFGFNCNSQRPNKIFAHAEVQPETVSVGEC